MQTKRLQFAAEIKAVGEEGNIGKIKGYGSVFGVVDSYNEVCDKGCFSASLKKYGMPAMLIQHSPYDVGGMWTKADEDDKGLLLEGEMNLEVQKAREAYSLAKQGALKGLSIGFRTLDSYYEGTTRHLKEVMLMEVSVVTFPANDKARITGVKSALPATEREFEDYLRDAGFSRTQAKAITARGFKTAELEQRDAELADIISGAKVLARTLQQAL